MTKSIYSEFSPKKISEIPTISRFTVERDSAFVGYKVRLRWLHEDASIIGFKVWRSNSPKVLLKKEYEISQAALERTTGLKSRDAQGTSLYNKSFFSQNSKVKFFNSESNRYDKPNEVSEMSGSATFIEVGFVSKNKMKQYEFVDKRVKFGETYYYAISCVNIDFFESFPSDPIEVGVEDTRHPDSPTDVSVTSGGSSVVIKIKNNKAAEDIEKYLIYRREQDEKQFSLITEVEATGDVVTVSDSSVLPSVKYYYKIYSVDFFGNISFSSPGYSVVHSSFLPLKKDSKFPDFDLVVDSGEVIIKGYKNSNDVLGHKIERQDSWKFDKSFEIKKYNGIEWQNLNLFDSSGSYEFIDRTADIDRIYRYRVSSVGKNGSLLRNVITPHINIQNGFEYSIRDAKQLQTGSVDILNFEVEIDDKKEFPLFAKMQWDIVGTWEYLDIEIEKIGTKGEPIPENERIKSVRVDSIHSTIFYEGLEEGNTYIIRLNVFDIDGDIVAVTDINTEAKVVL